MKRTREIVLVFGLLAAGIQAAEAGECRIASRYSGEGFQIRTVFGPSGQISASMGNDGREERSRTTISYRCDRRFASPAPHGAQSAKRNSVGRAVSHVDWKLERNWRRHHGWQRNRGQRQPHWQGRPHRRPNRGGLLDWHRHRGWSWHLHPRFAREHHLHGRYGHRNRYRGHR